jgi:hypothetical protein
MASIIKAGNATDGVQVSSDATGALDIKTGTGAGTTAISIDASQNVTIAGSLTVGAGTVYNLEQYTSPATWTKPAGLKAIKVTVVGAGGDGGATNAPGPTSLGGSASGGGGGGAAIEFIPAPSIPGPVSVTAGAGTNSFGPFCSATAGGNGATTTTGVAGGAGGVGSGGNINVDGGDGDYGVNLQTSPTNQTGGAGGGALLGFGGIGRNSRAGTGPGNPGGNYGGGGGGAAGIQNNSGGTGAPGIVIVEEFY